MADSDKEANEINALRAANNGLREKIRSLELEYARLEAEALSQFADYDEKLCKLRRVVAGRMASDLIERSAKTVGGAAPTG